MSDLFVWPWKNDEELLEVRALLYPSADLDTATQRSKQQLGVNIINAWKLRRCRIPHSITATADLVDAMLHHDPLKNSTSTIKAVYASALAKLVTTICDLEQDSVFKLPMMEQARKIGMPEEWVTLRHAITHGQTPGLGRLERAVREAVPWMWGHFWGGLEGVDELGIGEVRRLVGKVLVEYRKGRREEVAKKRDGDVGVNATEEAAKAVRKLCRKNVRGLEVLVAVMLEESILLPSAKQSNLKFKAMLLVWNDLLLEVASRIRHFQTQLAQSLAQLLTHPARTTAMSENELEMATKWLQHILIHPTWASKLEAVQLDELLCDVVETCMLWKSPNNTTIIENVLSAMAGSQRETLVSLVEECKKAIEMEVEDEEDEQEPEEDDISLGDLGLNYGWSRPVAIWLPT